MTCRFISCAWLLFFLGQSFALYASTCMQDFKYYDFLNFQLHKHRVCCHQACCILYAVSTAGGAVGCHGVCSGGVSVFITHRKSDAWWLDQTEHTNNMSLDFRFYSYFLSSRISLILFNVKLCCVYMWLTSIIYRYLYLYISYTLSSVSVKYLETVLSVTDTT